MPQFILIWNENYIVTDNKHMNERLTNDKKKYLGVQFQCVSFVSFHVSKFT